MFSICQLCHENGQMPTVPWTGPYSNHIIPKLKSIWFKVSNLCDENIKKTDVISLKILNSEDLQFDLINEHIVEEIDSPPKFDVIPNKSVYESKS